MSKEVIRSLSEASDLRDKVLSHAEYTTAWLRTFAGSPIELFSVLRFKPMGHDPLTGESLHVIEQLNQTFTILASLRAVEFSGALHREVLLLG